MSDRVRPSRRARPLPVAFTEEEPPRPGRGQKRGRDQTEPSPNRRINATDRILIGPNMYFLKKLVLDYLRSPSPSNSRVNVWETLTDKQKGSWTVVDLLLSELSNYVLQADRKTFGTINKNATETDRNYTDKLIQIFNAIDSVNIWNQPSPRTITITDDIIMYKIINSWLDGSHDEYIDLPLIQWLDSQYAKELYPVNRHRNLVTEYLNKNQKALNLIKAESIAKITNVGTTPAAIKKQLNSNVVRYISGLNKTNQTKLLGQYRIYLESQTRMSDSSVDTMDYIQKLVWFCPIVFDGMYTSKLTSGTFERQLKTAMPKIFNIVPKKIPSGQRLRPPSGGRIYLGIDQEEKTGPLSALITTSGTTNFKNRNGTIRRIKDVPSYANIGNVCDPGAMMLPNGIIQDVRGITEFLTGRTSSFVSQIIYEVGPFQLNVLDSARVNFESINLRLTLPKQSNPNKTLVKKSLYINFTLNDPRPGTEGLRVDLTSTGSSAARGPSSVKAGKKYGDSLPGIIISTYENYSPLSGGSIRALGTGDSINAIDSMLTSIGYFNQQIHLFVDFAIKGEEIYYYGGNQNLGNASRLTRPSPTGLRNKPLIKTPTNVNGNYLRQSGASINNSRITDFKNYLRRNTRLRAPFNRLMENNQNNRNIIALKEKLLTAVASRGRPGINEQAIRTILTNPRLNPRVAPAGSAAGGRGAVAEGNRGEEVTMGEQEASYVPPLNILTANNIRGSFVNINARLTNQTIKNQFYQTVSEAGLSQQFRILKSNTSQTAEVYKQFIVAMIAQGNLDLAIQQLRSFQP